MDPEQAKRRVLEIQAAIEAHRSMTGELNKDMEGMERWQEKSMAEVASLADRIQIDPKMIKTTKQMKPTPQVNVLRDPRLLVQFVQYLQMVKSQQLKSQQVQKARGVTVPQTTIQTVVKPPVVTPNVVKAPPPPPQPAPEEMCKILNNDPFTPKYDVLLSEDSDL